jgi:hypothetical protein
VICRH